MTRNVSPRPTLFLQPGEMVVLTRPSLVKTVLGSCVAITMRAPGRGLASIAHCLLPNAGAPFETVPPAERCRYVDSAVARMLEAFARRGVTAADLEVKLFGGSDNIEKLPGIVGFHVGSRNVAAALRALALSGMQPVSTGVGGRRGRLIEFNTSTGDVYVKRLPAAAAQRPKGVA